MEVGKDIVLCGSQEALFSELTADNLRNGRSNEYWLGITKSLSLVFCWVTWFCVEPFKQCCFGEACHLGILGAIKAGPRI